MKYEMIITKEKTHKMITKNWASMAMLLLCAVFSGAMAAERDFTLKDIKIDGKQCVENMGVFDHTTEDGHKVTFRLHIINPQAIKAEADESLSIQFTYNGEKKECIEILTAPLTFIPPAFEFANSQNRYNETRSLGDYVKELKKNIRCPSSSLIWNTGDSPVTFKNEGFWAPVVTYSCHRQIEFKDVCNRSDDKKNNKTNVFLCYGYLGEQTKPYKYHIHTINYVRSGCQEMPGIFYCDRNYLKSLVQVCWGLSPKDLAWWRANNLSAFQPYTSIKMGDVLTCQILDENRGNLKNKYWSIQTIGYDESPYIYIKESECYYLTNLTTCLFQECNEDGTLKSNPLEYTIKLLRATDYPLQISNGGIFDGRTPFNTNAFYKLFRDTNESPAYAQVWEEIGNPHYVEHLSESGEPTFSVVDLTGTSFDPDNFTRTLKTARYGLNNVFTVKMHLGSMPPALKSKTSNLIWQMIVAMSYMVNLDVDELRFERASPISKFMGFFKGQEKVKLISIMADNDQLTTDVLEAIKKQEKIKIEGIRFKQNPQNDLIQNLPNSLIYVDLTEMDDDNQKAIQNNTAFWKALSEHPTLNEMMIKHFICTNKTPAKEKLLPKLRSLTELDVQGIYYDESSDLQRKQKYNSQSSQRIIGALQNNAKSLKKLNIKESRCLEAMPNKFVETVAILTILEELDVRGNILTNNETVDLARVLTSLSYLHTVSITMPYTLMPFASTLSQSYRNELIKSETLTNKVFNGIGLSSAYLVSGWILEPIVVIQNTFTGNQGIKYNMVCRYLADILQLKSLTLHSWGFSVNKQGTINDINIRRERPAKINFV